MGSEGGEGKEEGRAGHIGPFGLLGRLFPQRGRYVTGGGTSRLDSGAPRRPLAVVVRKRAETQGPGRRRLRWSRLAVMRLDQGEGRGGVSRGRILSTFRCYCSKIGYEDRQPVSVRLA